MSIYRIFAIVLRQFYLIRGSFSRLFPLFVWAAVDMVLWGFLTKYLNSFVPSGFNFVTALLGAVLLWDFFIRIMQGVTMAFFEDVWSRNFLNIFATPILISEYVSGLIFSSIATSTIGLTVMLLIVGLFFKLSILVYGLTVFPFILVLFLFGISIGIFGSALVLHLGPAAEWFIWPIPALISPFVGVLYPISTLPAWMQFVSRLLPPSYVFEGLRTIVSGGQASMATLAWAACLALGYIFLAYLFFTRIYQNALRTGLIARYSAESLS
ncbi:MAG: ABC transporter permease [Candidatus Omnitrophica bacterium]|nr:ABC transporter permease [Candidatus Omnitrophota bacterium]MDD5352840.1 ABC transporter permease [Candidatus Omnitrophota bacterium]MDD5550439.1 ABC transporter permease [Candidatus Omnitrophota bacterium]